MGAARALRAVRPQTRAVIYARVSTDRTGRGRSVEQQETECRAFAASQGWVVVRVFQDNDRSASRYSTKDRPEFLQLSAFLAGDGADVLLTWEASRPSRDMETFLPLRELCRTLGVLYSYGERVYDLTDPDDLERVTSDMARAEAESGRTSKRVQRDVRANAAAGRPHGRNTYGYLRVYDSTTGQLADVVEHPEQGPVVRELARRVLAGDLLWALRADLLARGVPAPGRQPWDLGQIRRILLNPAYRGLRTHRGEVVGPAMWPAILDQDQWDQLQAILLDPTRRSTVHQGQVRHLLSYVAVCGRCGAPACARRQREATVYACSGTSGHFARPQGRWRGWPDRAQEWTDRYDGVDDVVVCAILGRLAMPDVLTLFETRLPGLDERTAARREAGELQARLDGFVDAAAAGSVSPTALARIEARLRPQIAAAQDRAQQPGVPQVVRDLAGPTPGRRWPQLALVQQREVIRWLARVELHPAGSGNRRRFDHSTVRIVWKHDADPPQRR